MQRENLLAELMAKPDAVLIMDALKTSLDAEIPLRKGFYDLNHDNFKAEFINGEVFFHPPHSYPEWNANARISSMITNYIRNKKLGIIGMNKVLISLTRNDYEPDIVFFKKEKSDRFSPEQMLFPAPDLAIEILSPSTEKNDREIKFWDYASHGVEEYWIVDPEKKTIEQYLLSNGTYNLNVKLQAEGILHCVVVDGFQLDAGTIFD